ncbi:ATP-binding protein [Neobacillus sp. MER 74]|uniref:hybrid sensor histidine kinase/response regulator n=1 Tax=Neobacillus sp. MER 74 TaxID=2939566 RepID=UPI00203D6775|nr:response regulator [Neobacillus sp. MER 74]MCM3117846.1 ATP-binding protein [Neobacillus sp. MER 74]
MKFKTKLYTSIGSLLVLFFIIAVILMNMLKQTTVNMNIVVNDLNERIEMASEIKYETSRIGLELTSMLTVRGKDIQLDAANSWEDSHTKLQSAIESLEKMDKQEKSKELIAKFKTLHDQYLYMGQQALTAKKLNREMEIPADFWTDSELISQRMIQIADLLYGLQEQKMKDELLRSKDTYNWAVTIIYIYLAIALCIGIVFTIWIIRGITNNLNKITEVMKSAITSDFSSLPRIKISSKGELAEIAVSFNKMAHALEEQSKLEKQLKEEAEDQSWLNAKIAEIATIYPEVETVSMLAELLITKLVPMVGASCGVFYVKEVEEREQYLKKISAYASLDDNKDYMRFRIGEGLIGQCALEKRSILLTNVPDHYVKIGSGTGAGSPKNIMILPIQFENEVQAVMEIASFESFSPLQVKLLEAVIHNIGIKINSIVSHMKAERLLQESQALTEELQAQSEELQLQQEELRTTNEKLEEQYIASEQKNREIEKVREDLEEKAQQLELSSQYKSEFLANMSHELRTPLNSLLILAQILAENGDGNLTVEQVEYIRTIYSSGNDLLLLINDVLDLAKVESGKLDVNPKEVNLHDVQDFIERQFAPLAIQKNVQFSIKMQPSLAGTVYTDEQRLQQILKNLLSNAFKFTERGSVSLDIRRERKDVSGELIEGGSREQAMLAFSVIDTGIGIDKDKQKTIFDAFKQADGTTSRQYGGTGLGLSISREMAQLLGGYIEVSSTKGYGSTFTLYLPFIQTNSHIVENTAFEEAAISLYEDDSLKDIEGPIKQEGISSLKNKKILIVDDDIRNVYALTIALEKFEMDIIVAENGREGIEVLKENPETDLVLMDIMMPEMDGFEAMRRIRQMTEFQTIPIIALTAKAMKRSREECLEAGATDYISKPINLDQLFSLMQVWLYSKEG